MRIPRIYYSKEIFINEKVVLNEKKIVHYIKNVLKKKKNDYIKLFNKKKFVFLKII